MTYFNMLTECIGLECLTTGMQRLFIQHDKQNDLFGLDEVIDETT